MTALDILRKHLIEFGKTQSNPNHNEIQAAVDELCNEKITDAFLAAMREIAEMMWHEGYKRIDDELERTTTDIDLEDRLKQLFPEK